VEAGEIGISVGASAADIRGRLTLQLTGPEREVGHDRVLTTPAGRSPA
jgi:beta-xylosidase